MSHAMRSRTRAFHFVDNMGRFILLSKVHATRGPPSRFYHVIDIIVKLARHRERLRNVNQEGLTMTYLTKKMMGVIAATGVMMTSPVFAAAPGWAPAHGYHQLAASSDYHKRKKHHKHDRDNYARHDQRINSNTRVWRGEDGRYRCKRDNGTTGLLIGGAVGGLAGNEIAGNGDKLLGTVLGAAGGALLGREIDRDKYRCR